MIAESIGLEDDACQRWLELAQQFGFVNRREDAYGEDAYELSAQGYSFCACDDRNDEPVRAAPTRPL
jgi:hypothetical protein